MGAIVGIVEGVLMVEDMVSEGVFKAVGVFMWVGADLGFCLFSSNFFLTS